MIRKHPVLSDKTPPSDAEQTAWATVKSTVKPLKNNKIATTTKTAVKKPTANTKKTTIPPLPLTEFEKLLHASHRSAPLCNTVQTGRRADELRVGDTSRINRSQSRKLRAGTIAIDSVLDLHGCTQQQAYEQLHGFMTHALLRGHRKVKIITGKGKGVLKNALPEWLNTSAFKPYILTIVVARPQHGGTGAYYVLLKNTFKR